MSDQEVRPLEVLEAMFDEEIPAHDPSQVVSWVRVQAVYEAAHERIGEGWAQYLEGLREARRRSPDGMVPVQEDLPREVALARIAALQGQFPGEVVAVGHRKLQAMTDGDLRSLLADIEELLATDA